MKVILQFILFFTLTSCASLGGRSSFKMRKFHETSLSNGLRVLYIEDSSLPYFSLNLLVGAGSSSDPQGQEGLANLVAELLGKGTTTKNATEVAEALDFIAADFSATVDHDYTWISAGSLSFHQDQLIKLFSDIVMQPAFHGVEAERLKKNIAARIQREADEPSGFTNRILMSFLYQNHPYAQPVSGTVKSVQGIQQRHINRFFLKNYRPNRSILAVIGKFDSGTKEQIENAFSAWTEREAEEKQSLPEFPVFAGRQVLLVDKPSSVQAQVRIGMKGISRDNKDFVKIRLANSILGGAFASRLNDQIRDNLGLTYYIGSQFDAKKSEGPFAVTTYTRNEKVGEIVSESLRLLEEFHKNGATEEELAGAKGLLRGHFPRSIETAEKLAFNLVSLRFYGIPDSYLSDYLKNLEAVSLKDLNATIKKYFSPENAKIVVYGDAKSAKAQLQGFGDVRISGFKEFQK